jgi:hypothetical protein
MSRSAASRKPDFENEASFRFCSKAGNTVKTRKKNYYAVASAIVAVLLVIAFTPAVAQAHALQICKLSDQTSPVTGTFSFTVSGQSGTFSLAVGECIIIPNIGTGQFTVIEQPTAGTTVSSITVAPIANLVSFNLATGSVTVTVVEPGTTTVTFTNRTVISTGRFTSGGSIFTSAGVRVTHGFELHCSITSTPNNLEVNFAANRFHLDALTSVSCSVNPVTGVATITGTGTGTYNGVAGATIAFTFTDAGEPGTSDVASYLITDASGTVVLSASGTLTFGNQEFHRN